MEEEKKSFWKDKKNVAIVVLSLLLLVSIGSTSSEPTPNGETAKLNSELNAVAFEKEELNEKLSDAENRVEYLSVEPQDKVATDEIREEKEIELEEYKNQVQALTSTKADLETQVQSLITEKSNLEGQIKSLTTENESLKKSNLSTSQSDSTTTPASTTVEAPQPDDSYTVYVTDTGSKYHRDGCGHLKSKNAIDKNSAITQGYAPCSRCHP